MGRGAKSELSCGKVAAAIKQEAMQPAGAGAVIGAPEPGGPSPAMPPEARAKLAEIRARLEVRVGQLVLMLMNVPRYRHQTLADLNHLILEPLLRDRIAIAHARPEGAKDDSPVPEGAPLIGVAIWASVSDEVDAKIKEQVKAGAFPVRLASDEWASGEKIWLLDIVAVSKGAASAVLAKFGTIAGERTVQLHPLVKRQLELAA